MLDVAKLRAGREDYYLREIAGSLDEYYAGHGEAAGRWYGSPAEAMGLRGVAADGTEGGNSAFKQLFHGRDPRTGELLGRAHRKDGMRAYDLVFRPTKSVSVLYGLGDPEVAGACRDAHHAGIRAAVAYLERHVGARRGHNGIEKVAGRGLLAVGFDHRQSRAGDPLLHTHLIVANRIQGPDGRWTAIDGQTLYPQLLAADAIYRDCYQRELTRRLGVEWTRPDANGNRELVGIPADLIRHFSKRREQIELALEAWSAEGKPITAKVADLVAHKTRQGKEHGVSEPTLRGRWQAGTRAFGVDPDRLVHAAIGRRRELTLDASEVERAYERLLSPKGLTAQASTFGRQDIVKALGDQLKAGAAGELEQLAERFLAERAVPVVTDVARADERRWSTPELLALERRLVAGATSRQDEACAIVDRELATEAVERSARAGVRLGLDQEAMVRGILTDGQGVSVVVGQAGTGKTTATDAARYGFERAGFELVGLAPTGIAAQQLNRDTGMVTSTVDAFLGELRRGETRLTARNVVFVDETAMVGSRRLLPLLEHAGRANAKVVLIGDHKQFQSIDTGGGFLALRRRLGAYELTVNRRQRDPLDRRAVELIRAGRGDEAMDLFHDGGRVHVAETLAECDAAMVAD